MAGCGLGDRVILVRLREDRPLLQEHRQPAVELRAVALEIVGPQLVDGDDEHEPGLGRRRGGTDVQQGEEPQQG